MILHKGKDAAVGCIQDHGNRLEHLEEAPTRVPKSTAASKATFLKAEARRSSALPAMREAQRWMMDSGCGHDLVSEAEARAAAYPESKRHATIRVGGIDQTVRASELPNTPAVLSTGRRCVRDGVLICLEGARASVCDSS